MAPCRVVSAGLTYYRRSNQLGFSYTLRGRYLSTRTVESFDEISPPSTFLINAQIAYRQPAWDVTLEVLNALDSDDHDIDYFTHLGCPESQMKGLRTCIITL